MAGILSMIKSLDVRVFASMSLASSFGMICSGDYISCLDNNPILKNSVCIMNGLIFASIVGIITNKLPGNTKMIMPPLMAALLGWKIIYDEYKLYLLKKKREE